MSGLVAPKKKTVTTMGAEDFGMGNYDSDQCSNSDEEDGKDATPNISKGKVTPFLKFNSATIKDAEVPKISTSSANKKTTIGSCTTALEDLKRVLQKTKQWAEARDVIQQQLFQQLPVIDFDFAESFLIQAAESKEKLYHVDFVPALAAVIEAIDIK